MRFAFLILFFCFSACSKTAKDDWLKGEAGTVVRVLDGDTFALNTGQVVRMVSIEAPSFGRRGREDDPHAEDAKTGLEMLALGKRVQLFYPGLTRDRYDRALAQVFLVEGGRETVWINKNLVEQGFAWVRMYPDTKQGSDVLWQVEQMAREESAGLWNTPDSVHTDLASLPETGFVILVSDISNLTPNEDACVGDVAGAELMIEIRSFDTGLCQRPDGAYEARGWLYDGRLRLDDVDNLRPVKSAE